MSEDEVDFSQVDHKLEQLYPQMEKHLLQLLSYPSVEAPSAGTGAPFGQAVADALSYCLELAESLGLPTTNADGYLGTADMRGSSPELVGVLSHLDVVPANANDWQTPPFSPQVRDGRIYGRGALDDKGPLIASLYAGIALRDTINHPLTKTVRFMFGCNEESGFGCLKYYLQHHQPPSIGFSPDAEFPLIIGEKGICHFVLSSSWQSVQGAPLQICQITAGSAINIVPDRAEAVLELNGAELPDAAPQISLTREGNLLHIKATGKAAHASTPEEGDNALARLLAFLAQLPLEPSGASCYIRTLARLFADSCFGASLGVASEDEVSCLTVIPSVLELDAKGGTLRCDMRFPVTHTGDSYQQQLSSLAAQYQMQLQILELQEPMYAGTDNPVAKKLLQAYRDYTGDLSEPLVIGGGTYAKALPGFLAFGPEFAHTPKLCHQANEYITQKDLLDAAKIYSRAIYALAR